jgi:ketosteroid isomerase-like protein
MNRLLLATLVTTAGGLSAGSVPDSNGVSRPDPIPWCERIESRSQAGATAAHFARLLDEVAAGWNAGDARRAAACFTEDAVYNAAGDSTARHGRVALYDFFGGERGRPAPMSMTWHHRAFDSAAQVGFGEYTFGYADYRAHGVTVIRLRQGRIARWREYEVASAASWAEFTQSNPF